MAFIDFSEYDAGAVDQGGRPLPGKCQLLVVEVQEHDTYVNVTHQVVAHEKPGQDGKVSYNTFSTSGKGSRRALLFALATGLITKQDLAEAQATGTGIDIDYTAAESKVYFGTLEESEYNGKKKCRVEWDFKSIADKDAREYPISPKFPRPVPRPVKRGGQQPSPNLDTPANDVEVPF